MKPKFIEVMQLGVLLGFIALAVAFVLHAPTDASLVVQSVQGDGVGGVVSTLAMFAKWGFYAVVSVLFACALCLFLNAMGVLTAIVERIARGIASIVSRTKQTISPEPSLVETVIGTRRGGEAITLGGLLAEIQKEIKALKAKTAGIEPPPPPKSAEELLAERDAKLAELQAELEATRAAMKAAAAKPAVAPVAPVAPVVPLAEAK